MKIHLLLHTIFALGLVPISQAAVVGAFWNVASASNTTQVATVKSTTDLPAGLNWDPVLTLDNWGGESGFNTTQGGTLEFTNYEGTVYNSGNFGSTRGWGSTWQDTPGTSGYPTGSFYVSFETTGLEDLAFTFSGYKRNGFTIESDILEYRINGGSWVTIATDGDSVSSGGSWFLYSEDLSGVSAIENLGAGNVVDLRYRFLYDEADDLGAINYRFEGVQITGNVIPEPSAATLLLGVLGLGLLVRRQRL